jgi:hypothetical protein
MIIHWNFSWKLYSSSQFQSRDRLKTFLTVFNGGVDFLIMICFCKKIFVMKLELAQGKKKNWLWFVWLSFIWLWFTYFNLRDCDLWVCGLYDCDLCDDEWHGLDLCVSMIYLIVVLYEYGSFLCHHGLYSCNWFVWLWFVWSWFVRLWIVWL